MHKVSLIVVFCMADAAEQRLAFPASTNPELRGVQIALVEAWGNINLYDPTESLRWSTAEYCSKPLVWWSQAIRG